MKKLGEVKVPSSLKTKLPNLEVIKPDLLMKKASQEVGDRQGDFAKEFASELIDGFFAIQEDQKHLADRAVRTSQTMNDYLQKFKHSKETYKTYGSLLKRFAKNFEYIPVKPEPIEGWLNQFPHDNTRYNYHKILKWFYSWPKSGVYAKPDEVN